VPRLPIDNPLLDNWGSFDPMNVINPYAYAVAGGGGYRYYRFAVYKNRQNDVGQAIDITEIELQSGGSRVAPSSASWYNSWAQWGDGAASMAIDNSLSTKAGGYLNSFPGGIIIDYGTQVTGDAFRWATPMDQPRDPVRWKFEGSNDQSSWATLHDQSGSDYAVTVDRQAWVGPFSF
jgi:hypothetical protein